MNKKEMKRQLWEHLLQELGKMLSTLKHQVDSYQKMKKNSFYHNYEMHSVER